MPTNRVFLFLFLFGMVEDANQYIINDDDEQKRNNNNHSHTHNRVLPPSLTKSIHGHSEMTAYVGFEHTHTPTHHAASLLTICHC